MKQVIQSYKDGRLRMVETPPPINRAGHVLLRTVASLVSTGTEKYMIELARKSLLGKALARPDLVRQFIAKAQTEGIMEAWRQAMSRLDTPVPLGYSSAGVVIDVGSGVEGFTVGDRVACAGSGYAGHAEIVSVPANLCVRIPDGVNFEAAAFVAMGGIALEAVRMAKISLGETVVIIGLGLLGQIAVQLLTAAGCHVIGMDIESQKAEMALQHGAEAVATDYRQLSILNSQFSSRAGSDAVIILAATPTNEPLEQAAELCRERGRIVAAGLVGLEIPRKPFYDKELELVVPRAWGPGLYDPNYTEKGLDYPISYVRWTAKRNMEEFLAQLDKGAVRVDHLITHRFPIDRALEAYELILEGKEPYIGVLLTYPLAEQKPETSATLARRIDLKTTPTSSARVAIAQQPSVVTIGLIGAGQFATGTLLPAMKGLKGLRLRGVATTGGLSARHVAEKFGFEYCTADYREILSDPNVDAVFIFTRHGSHAHLVAETLKAGKHVFVEKPLALTREQLQEISAVYKQVENNQLIMVGFNRRFSHFSRWLKERFNGIVEPLVVHCTVNAGMVPPDHWVHDPEIGGGRIIGEVCHFIDLIQYITGSLPKHVYAETLRSDAYKPSDNVAITVKMSNGAIGSIIYVSGGDKRYPRERIEIFGGGAVGVIENFQAASFTYRGRTGRIRKWLSVDRGHRGEVEAFLKAIQKGDHSPVAFKEYIFTTLATFAAEESLKRGESILVSWPEEDNP